MRWTCLSTFTQGSLTYCENKVKSKSKIVIYKHVECDDIQSVSELRAYGGCLGSWRRGRTC